MPYESDTFTEQEVISFLQNAGLHYKNGQRYILAQCPTHDDKNPSVQIYKDDWFVNCHSNCGRYHITKAFPELRKNNPSVNSFVRSQSLSRPVEREAHVTEHKYTQFNLMDEWLKMPLIPRNHVFKGLPLDVLDSLGWRWNESKNSYFIPYFSRSKTTIPFAQWRHLSGERRFTFLKDAKPTLYGTWNLEPNMKIFLVEGTSDFAVLDYCAVPCVAVPSAASGALVKSLAIFCVNNAIQLVYAGDNDAAGDKIREALEESIPYRLKQPPTKYKDWGEFFEKEGAIIVMEYCDEELYPKVKTILRNVINDTKTFLEEIFPEYIQLQIVDTSRGKEPDNVSTSPF